MKEAFYFQHDYESSNDPKIIALMGKFGAAGYGIYWRIIEILHSEPDHRLKKKQYMFEAIAKQMLTDVNQVIDLLEYACTVCELFEQDEQYLWSNRVLRNFQAREKLSIKRRLAGQKGGKSAKNNVNENQNKALGKQMLDFALQKETKEIKEKEIKEKEIKENKIKESMSPEGSRTFSENEDETFLKEVEANEDLSLDGDFEKEKKVPAKKRKRTQFEILQQVHIPFETEEFERAWVEWLKYRTERKIPYATESSMQAALKQLSEYSEEVAIKTIENSLAAGWQGLFPDKAYEQHTKKIGQTRVDYSQQGIDLGRIHKKVSAVFREQSEG
jgi:hypothetical protein